VAVLALVSAAAAQIGIAAGAHGGYAIYSAEESNGGMDFGLNVNMSFMPMFSAQLFADYFFYTQDSTEDHPAEPDSPYGASKLAAEKLCLAYAKLYDLEAICLRYFNVYGVNQRYDAYGNVIPIFAHRLLHGLPLIIYGDGEQTRDFVNVRDVARANLMAAEANGLSGAFNIASGTAITINHLASLIRDVSGIDTGYP